MRAYNFSAGPSMLPAVVMDQVQAECSNWQHGMSAMEVSHRSPAFIELVEHTEATLRRLMNIPDDYAVLFLPGGATMQFEMVPLNLAAPGDSADYFSTGAWSEKAIKYAAKHLHVNSVVTSGPEYVTIADETEWQFSEQAKYCHYTPNETIHGIEFPAPPQTDALLVGDFSSNILSKPIEVSQHDIIYAGAQKNMGPAGLCLVIIKRDLIGQARASAPAFLDYALHLKNESMTNTPPTFVWYVISKVFDWVEAEGGVSEMAKRNAAKASYLYKTIDDSDFYNNAVVSTYRSKMNVPFQLAEPELEQKFLIEAEKAGLMNLAGHRSIGGCRASIYNAMPLAGVEALSQFMKAFEQQYG